MRNWKFYMLCCLFILGASSCEKWLDVKPDSNTTIEQALVDREGFVKVLSSVYTQMGSTALYGRELEFGLMDVLAGYWEMSPANQYYGNYTFQYNSNGSQQQFLEIWSGLYSCIRQCNLLLDHLDRIETDPYFMLLKGEILGLRAYFHFELLKLFGPVISEQGLDMPAVPYYTLATKIRQGRQGSRQIFAQIESDLQQAKNLLSDDPIITVGREYNGNTDGKLYNALIDRRGIRMNYYAVLALLARKSQWEGDLAQAGKRAAALIDELNKTKAVRFIDKQEYSLPWNRTLDRRFTVENLFGLYVNDIDSKTKDYVGFSNSKLRPAYVGFLDQLYSNSSSDKDLRLSIWGMDDDNVEKFWPLSDGEAENSAYKTSHEVQLINLSELYFILAEALMDVDLKQALAPLNTVRTHRNLPEIVFADKLTREDVENYITDEVRREYIGEGYLFSFYKRLYLPVIRKEGNISPGTTIFTFPIPADELIYQTEQ